MGSGLTASSGSLGLPYVQSLPLMRSAASTTSLASSESLLDGFGSCAETSAETSAEPNVEPSTEPNMEPSTETGADVCTEMGAVRSEAEEETYVQFVPEGGDESTAYYLEKRLVGPPPKDTPTFTVLPPETLGLLSDSVVVLDAEREVFVWVGFERRGLKEDAVLSACMALALSLTQHRNPPAIIRVVKEGSSNSRFVLCQLIPSHKDPVEVAVKSVPVLRSLPPPLLKKHSSKFLRTDDMSFREYMAKIYHFRECCVCWRRETNREGEEKGGENE